jgi:tetratricopeptide (TPR) repeat protein
MYHRLPQLMIAAMEGIVLFLVAFSAWPFGSVHAYFQWILLVAVALLLGLWAARAILTGRVLWVRCPVVIGLAALCALAMVQLVPLDRDHVEMLSPRTAELQDFLLPTAAECKSAGLHEVGAEQRTLSLDAAATRGCLLQLIAVLALYAVVRNNLRDPGSFYRLAWLCAANGVALALVGMSQLASSPPNVVFWSFPTRGQVFGPFICRNHFAYYANLCLGLTAGLLLGTRYFLAGPRGAAAGVSQRTAWRYLFRDSRVLWLAVGLAILLAGLVASLSRGGVLGIVVGAGVAGMLMFARPTAPRWTMAAGVLMLAALLVGWLGMDRVTRRWDEVWQDNFGAEARTAVWLRTFPLVARFPILGSGLGTFGLVEPPTRPPNDSATLVHDHAHNDFLELWIEGGTGQLLVVLIVIALVTRQGMHAYFRHSSNAMGRLALGGLAGCIAVTVQSFVDFGLRVPAVAVLAAVVAAMLSNLAELSPAEAVAEPGPEPPPRQTLLAFCEAGALMAVALFLVSAGHRAEQVERFRLAALTAPRDRALAYLQTAVRLAPDRADLHLAVADALVRDAGDTARCRQVLAGLAVAPASGWPMAATAGNLADRMAVWTLPLSSTAWAARQHAILAQAQSPLSFDAHEKAFHLERLAHGDEGSGRALARLRFLGPSDPAAWFLSGQRALRGGDRDVACAYWRHALLASDRYLPEITGAVPSHLSPEQLLEQVLPPKPMMIVSAIKALAPGTLTADDEERFHRTALAVLARQGEPRSGTDEMLAARIHDRLGETAAARAAYQAALVLNPRSSSWRMEFCQFLHRTNHHAEARVELLVLMDQEPANRAAQQLYDQVVRSVAETN